MRQFDEPTDALPGTEAKIQVLRYRAEHELEMFHPDDAKWNDENPMSSRPLDPSDAANALLNSLEDLPLTIAQELAGVVDIDEDDEL